MGIEFYVSKTESYFFLILLFANGISEPANARSKGPKCSNKNVSALFSPYDFYQLSPKITEQLEELKAPQFSVVRYNVKFKDLPKYQSPLPSYLPPPTGPPPRLDPDDIKFMQGDIVNTTQDGLYTVLQNAVDIRSGKLQPENIPPIRVWRDSKGMVWTLDHRRLASIKLAGYRDKIPVVWVSKDEVLRQNYKFTNKDAGRSIHLKLESGWALKIGSH
jgi:hypothetical protein